MSRTKLFMFLQIAANCLVLIITLCILLMAGPFEFARLFDVPGLRSVIIFGSLLLILNRKSFWPSNYLIASLALFFPGFLQFMNSRYPDAATRLVGLGFLVLVPFYGAAIGTIGSFAVLIANRKNNSSQSTLGNIDRKL